MMLRWVEAMTTTDTDVPLAAIRGWPECGNNYYKLQHSVDGEWVDVEIEWNTSTEQR